MTGKARMEGRKEEEGKKKSPDEKKGEERQANPHHRRIGNGSRYQPGPRGRRYSEEEDW